MRGIEWLLVLGIVLVLLMFSFTFGLGLEYLSNTQAFDIALRIGNRESYILHDHYEHGTENVVKQLALRKLGGCSIGKLRSHVGEKSYLFLGYYPNDIFFVPSKDSAKRLISHSNSVIVELLRCNRKKKEDHET